MTDTPEYLSRMDIAALAGGAILVTELTEDELIVGVLDTVSERYDWVIEEQLDRGSPTARMWHKVAVTGVVDASALPDVLHEAVVADTMHTHAAQDKADTAARETASSDDSDDEPDWVTLAEEWLIEQYDADLTDYRVSLHPDFGSINIEVLEYVDEWQDIRNEIEHIEDAWYDSDERTFVFKQSVLEEVFK